MNHTNASLYLDTRRPSAKHNNKYPVKVKLTFKVASNKWTRVYYPCKIYLSEKDFARIIRAPKNDEDQAAHNTMFASLNKAIGIINKVKNITPSTFDQLFHGSDITSLSNYFELRQAQLITAERSGDLHVYKYAIKSFEKFNQGSVYFNDITPNWLEEYERFMIDQKESITTIGIYLRTLRSVLNHAITNHVIMPDVYPFGRGKHKIKTERKIKIPLNDAQILKLKNYEPKGMTEHRALSLWFFSYYGNGMNLLDIFKLRHSDIVNDFIIFDRAKTRNTKNEVRKILVPMRDELRQTILRYGNRTLDPNGLIFPLFEGAENSMKEKQRLKTFRARANKVLKAIGESMGINNLRMGIARHTFANRMLNNGASNEYLQYALGHSNPSTTEHYKGSFMIDTIEKASKML
jgi:site-specific recombinase XerD